MSHIKDRLSDFHEWAKDIANKCEMIIAKDFLDVIEQLQDDLEQDEKENGWIPVDERLPDPDKYILVSFENFSLPMVGRYTVDDDDGGTFRVGDEDESFIENDLYVNVWMELPKCYKED